MRRNLLATFIAAALFSAIAGCPDGGGAPCGGLAGMECPGGQFCNVTDGSCGAADQTGVCTRPPEACPAIFAPVCGCDGRTYGNDCEAAAAGVSVQRSGECEDDAGSNGLACGGPLDSACQSEEYCRFARGNCGEDNTPGQCATVPTVCPEIFAPVCGCDGETYAHDCEAAAARVNVRSEGECGTNGIVATPCGGIAGLPCEQGEFCRFEPGTCGAADQAGICEVRPEACPDIFDPVCGCDGNTYGNECEASAAGVSIEHTGECHAGAVSPRPGDGAPLFTSVVRRRSYV